MLKVINAILSAQSPTLLAVLSFLLIAIVGALDYATGYELSFSIFYLLPVVIGSWYLRRSFGLVISFVSAMTWLGVDFMSHHQYSHMAIPFWNAVVRLGFFLTVAYLLEHLQRALEFQSSLAQLDGLTDLMNARAFKQRCNSLFALASRHR